jgi:amino acid adenylation domain-containing protein
MNKNKSNQSSHLSTDEQKVERKLEHLLSCFNTGLAGIFEQQVANFPDKTAIITSDSCLSYDQLNQRANRLGHFLLKQIPANENDHSPQPIILLLRQGIDYLVALIAALKAGKTVIPVDPNDPESRTKYVLEHSKAKAIISYADFKSTYETLTESEARFIEIESWLSEDSDESGCDGNLNLKIEPQSLAYILYTSGSTGHPKGVMQSNINAYHNALLHRYAFSITNGDVQSLLYGTSVYGGTRDIFNALLNGAALAFYPLKQVGFSGLGNWIQHSDITILCCVATVFRQFIGSNAIDDTELKKVRIVKLGGEATYKSEIDGFQAHFPPDCLLHCGLGSTETGLVRQQFITTHTTPDYDPVPLGFAVGHKEVLLLGEDGKPVAQGDVGEIVIRSPYITHGYWRQKELTDAAFSIDTDGITRIYRSGDLGMFDETRCLHHRGRKDHQVKVRGYRVELPEIEKTLRNHDRVKEAAVIAKPDEKIGAEIICYIVPHIEAESGKGPLEANDLRDFLLSKLPSYMLPKRYVFIDRMPQTTNGKIDRKALPQPPEKEPATKATPRRPRSELESFCVEIWKSKLGIKDLGIDDDFSELGGDSLSAVELISQLELLFKRKIGLVNLIRLGTIAKLVDSLDDAERSTNSFALTNSSVTDRPALFCIYGTMMYKPLADQLAEYCQTFGVYLDFEFDILRSQHLDKGRLPPLPKLAEMYIEKIRATQAHGPYYIAGLSFGGLVAFEVSKQLQEAGEEVGFVAMIDTHPMWAVKTQLRGYLYNFRQRIPQWWRYQVVKGLKNRFFNDEKASKEKTDKDEKIDTGYLDYLRSEIRTHASTQYKPDPIKGQGILFKAYEGYYGPGFTVSEDLGWKDKFIDDLKIYDIPGDHLSLLKKPSVELLAQKLLSHMEALST